jgi:hypothetical protein
MGLGQAHASGRATGPTLARRDETRVPELVQFSTA